MGSCLQFVSLLPSFFKKNGKRVKFFIVDIAVKYFTFNLHISNVSKTRLIMFMPEFKFKIDPTVIMKSKVLR